jgi:hypothetical protein
MPAAISKLPRGLTALLSLRDQGQTPQLLADQAVQVVESRDLFLLDTRELINVGLQTTPVVGANFFTPDAITVPAGELWYVWHYGVASSPLAGEAITFAAAVQMDGLPIMVPMTAYIAGAATQEVRIAAAGFWAGPGSKFGFLVQTVTLAPDVNGFCVVTKLKI